MSQNLNSAVAVIGIDIGKNSFHVVGLDDRGAIVQRQKWSRGQVEARLANMPPCLIGMEACVGAHHLSRKLKGLGHDARLMPAKYVRPYSKGQKNDFRDAEAIAEAVQRPTMKFVATKTADQLDLQALHRVRERLVSQRTGIINQIRAFLLERGVAVRQGLRFLRAELPRILAKPSDVLSARMVRIIENLAEDWRRLDERIDQLSGEIAALARQDAGCERLMSVPGIGPIISSAMVAAIAAGEVFSKGRDFAAWLGLVPKQISTGDRTILGKISKRGNRYLRVLFVQAAWVVLIKPQSWDRHGLKAWLDAAKKRLHRNVLAIALANKLVRDEHALVAAMIKAQMAARGGGLELSLSDRNRETLVKSVQVYLLLGGLAGLDGSLTSAGMFQLAKMLRALPDTKVRTYTWDKWAEAYKTILANEGKAKIVVVGYSGGGSRATWLANMPKKPPIDLMVNYDPSPKWQMKSIGTNVKKALCFHNTKPMMWMPGVGDLGGGQLVGNAPGFGGRPGHGPIEIINIAEQHMLVQVDQSLHERTVKAVGALAGATPARTEPRLASLPCKRVALCQALNAMRQPEDRGLLSIAELSGAKREPSGRKTPL